MTLAAWTWDGVSGVAQGVIAFGALHPISAGAVLGCSISGAILWFGTR